MIKRETGSVQIGMVRVVNSESKCICGKHFDENGICDNGHIQGGQYDVPQNWVKEETGKRASVSKVKVTCKREGVQRFRNRCNICGKYIPEGDNVCESGHILGLKYLMSK